MIFIAALAALTAFVAAPLYARRQPAQPTRDRASLEARRDVLLSALRELELDRLTDAVDDVEYAQQRARAESEAAEVMRLLEQSRD